VSPKKRDTTLLPGKESREKLSKSWWEGWIAKDEGDGSSGKIKKCRNKKMALDGELGKWREGGSELELKGAGGGSQDDR